MPIPARLHFCWIGTHLSWASIFAVLSASRCSGMPEIILHHTDPLDEGDEVRALRQAPWVRLSLVDPALCLAQVGRMLGVGDALADLYNKLDSPVMRSDILRAALLYREGGVYLDLDTVAVGSLVPLLDARQFVGCELTVWPHAVRMSRSPGLLAYHVMLDLLRKLMRQLPNGWKTFRRIDGLYTRSINNAVMGAEANSPLLADYLRAMLDVSVDQPMRRYALGPDLLQSVAAGYTQDNLVIQPPAVFYPLPPEISEHWFRLVRGTQLDAVLFAETRIVHWYASVRTRSLAAEITPDYVRRNRDRQLYSALVSSSLGTLLDTL